MPGLKYRVMCVCRDSTSVRPHPFEPGAILPGTSTTITLIETDDRQEAERWRDGQKANPHQVFRAWIETRNEKVEYYAES